MTAVLVAAGLTMATPPGAAVVPGANGPIVFDSDRTGEMQIYTVEADGSARSATAPTIKDTVKFITSRA